jgi:hypothetical protein
LVEIDTDAERILGSFRLKEYDALRTAKLPNRGRLNLVFEHMGVPYALCPLLGTEAFLAVTKKWKGEMSKKPATKKAKGVQSKATPAKMVPPKKKSILKVIQPKAKLGPKGTSEIELAQAKPIEVSKKFCLLDVPSSSHGPRDQGRVAIKVGGECASRVVTFDNLGDDSSLDIHEASSPRETEEVPPPPPPFIPG